MIKFSKHFIDKLHQKPTKIDGMILCGFVILITLQPFFMHGEINLFETGLYLPGINAIFHGLIPYKDFFHLRGPLELYIPAALMAIFGKHIIVLYSYFYFGTVLTLITCVLIARELYKTRYLLYLMVPVLVGRTFPRVVFTYWGGMRFAFGLLALLCSVRFFKDKKKSWILWAGIFSALGFYTSIQTGVCAIAGISLAFLCSFLFDRESRSMILKSSVMFLIGLLLVAIPYSLYLIATKSFVPFLDSISTVTGNLIRIINPDAVPVYPQNLIQAFSAMINPWNKNFRHMTPAYLYVFLFVYLALKVKSHKLDRRDFAIISIGGYGVVMYYLAFYAIWAAQFEMALQPEKILLFFILGEVYVYLRGQKSQIALTLRSQADSRKKSEYVKLFTIYFLFLGLLTSSFFYSMIRYNKRFFVFQMTKSFLTGARTDDLIPFKKIESRPLRIDRVKDIYVPVQQADELESISEFIKIHTKSNEPVFMYQQLGVYSFFFDRPFIGRFPLPEFTWLKEDWHKEFISDFKRVKPRFVILPRSIPKNWREVYLTLPEARKEFEDVMNIIYSRYDRVHMTPLSYIYQLKNSP